MRSTPMPPSTRRNASAPVNPRVSMRCLLCFRCSAGCPQKRSSSARSRRELGAWGAISGPPISRSILRAMDRYGYWNKILHVNLTERRTWIEEPGDVFFRRYAGGRGLIAHYLLKHVPKGADPLGPDNILVIAPGLPTGAAGPGAGR